MRKNNDDNNIISYCLHQDNVVACTNSEKANLLNTSFINSFNIAIPELFVEDIPEVPHNDCPGELLCTEEEVYDLLSTLDVSKSNGLLRNPLLQILGTPLVADLRGVRGVQMNPPLGWT